MDEMRPLWEFHYKEIALYDFPIAPMLNVYQASEIGNVLRIFTARDEEKLVGYEFFFGHLHPHFSYLFANQDALYLAPKMRRGFAGYKFLRFVDEELKTEKVKAIFRRVTARFNYGVLLERMGYEESERVFSRRILWEPQ